MKKLLLICATALFGFGQAHAQLDADDYGFLNHVSFGVSAGTTGIGFQLAAPLSANFALRAEYSFMPKFSYKQNVNVGSDPAFLTNNVDLEGKLDMGDFSVLFDWYPSKKSTFHFTAGAYFGKEKVVSVKNKEPFVKQDKWGTAGLELGSGTDTYTLVSNKENGDVEADLKVNSFKPYLGIGFGRAVPKKRIGVQFDLGVQFWGKPEVWSNINAWDDAAGDWVTANQKIDKDKITNPDKDYQDAKDAIKTIEKFGVYPVMTFRIVGRLF